MSGTKLGIEGGWAAAAMAARRAAAAIAAAATVAVTTTTVPEGLRAAWAARIDPGVARR